MVSMRPLAAAFVLALAAPTAAQGPAAPRLIFNHEKHVGGIGITCLRCHPGARNNRVPDESICGGCHDEVRKGSAPACTLCHADAQPEQLKAGESLRRGEGFDPGLWRCIDRGYDHAWHADGMDCTPCHPKAERSTRAEDDLYPAVRTKPCEVCHTGSPCPDAPDGGASTSRTASTATKMNGDKHD